MPRTRTEPLKAVQIKMTLPTYQKLKQLAFIRGTTMTEVIEDIIARTYESTDLTIKPVEVPAPAESPGWSGPPTTPEQAAAMGVEWVQVDEGPKPDLNERFALVDAAVDVKVDHGSSRRARPDFLVDDIPDL